MTLALIVFAIPSTKWNGILGKYCRLLCAIALSGKLPSIKLFLSIRPFTKRASNCDQLFERRQDADYLDFLEFERSQVEPLLPSCRKLYSTYCKGIN